ncbi:MAG: hypothetical protein AMXMBFR84_32890 [Candidatus Hydrogenedentota bacterium]
MRAMRRIQLDTESVVQRTRSAGVPVAAPSLFSSIFRGALGFTVVSVLGFAPWAVFGAPLYRHLGEAGLYVVCAGVFVAGSGAVMHRLIIGPGALIRFYGVFSIAFTVYSAAWILAWVSLQGHVGSLVGLVAGTVLMGLIIAYAFDNLQCGFRIIVVLFGMNAAGYFAGGAVDAAVLRADGLPLSNESRSLLAHTLWGACYGLGFGAGIGWAFYLVQARTRAAIKSLRTQGEGVSFQ